MAYRYKKRMQVSDSINVDSYMDEMLSGSALKHLDSSTNENDKKAIKTLYKTGGVDALFFNKTARGGKGFHDIFEEWFHRGAYYFAKERREEVLEEIAYAMKPFSNLWDRRSASSCLVHTGLTHDEIKKIEDLVESRATLIRRERNGGELEGRR
jgi:hypothetical protein